MKFFVCVMTSAFFAAGAKLKANSPNTNTSGPPVDSPRIFDTTPR